jgi:hypothetical protein
MSHRTTSLLRRAARYLGMIEEAAAKCRLLQARVAAAKAAGDPPADLGKEVAAKAAQMSADLDKYSRKLGTIYEELREHGYFFDMA